MKKAIFILSLAMIVLAACNRGTNIKKSVSYQGDVMKVEVYARIDGRVVQDFKKEINVAGLDKAEREAIAKHLMDSLNIPDNAGK